MPYLAALFESVTAPVVLWLVSALGLIVLGRRARSRAPAGPEAGFDYNINLMTTLPTLVLFVLMSLEMTLVMSTKLGTVYAAYSLGRSAFAWEAFGTPYSVPKGRQAVGLAMSPFSRPLSDADTGAAAPETSDAAGAYAGVYASVVGGPLSAPTLINQYLRADCASVVSLQTIAPPESVLIAQVQYRYPFRFPIIARLVGAPIDPVSGERYWTISTTIRRPRQEVLNGPLPLGIPYQPEP